MSLTINVFFGFRNIITIIFFQVNIELIPLNSLAVLHFFTFCLSLIFGSVPSKDSAIKFRMTGLELLSCILFFYLSLFTIHYFVTFLLQIRLSICNPLQILRFEKSKYNWIEKFYIIIFSL